ncbi:hypothetical protein FB45DRAFT_708540, partial [Roridomyces roridus]
SPFPALVTSNEAASDLQIPLISNVIQSAEQELERVQNAIQAFTIRATELKAFIRTHTATMSAVRCFPNKIMAEIFIRCVERNAPFDPSRNDQWVVARVCRLWRAVALNTPTLW